MAKVVESSSSLIIEAVRCLRLKAKLTGCHAASKHLSTCWVLGVHRQGPQLLHLSEFPNYRRKQINHQAILIVNPSFSKYLLSTFQV